MTTRVLAEPVLIGRENELEELQTFLNSAVTGKGTTVFVSGEAGAGKTRLITEFLNQAKKQSVTLLSGWCLSNAAVPYFPFFEAFNRYFSSEKESKEIELKSWLMGPPQASGFGNPQIVTPQVWKDQTFTAVANTLAEISTKHPVILFIDDLHWADSASLALISYLAFSVKSEKVLLLATYRSEQLTADFEGKPHPLVETLRLLRRQDLAKEIGICSLDEAGVAKLAQNMLGGGVQAILTQKLASESQGNPLFVVESLRMLYERNDLTLQGNQWQLSSNAIGIPQKIKDIILQRLDTLKGTQLEMLQVASVIGEKFDANLFAQVMGKDSLETIKALDLISKETSLVRCEGDLYRFDHARTRDAIYSEISVALKRVYHGKVALQLESASADCAVPLTDLAYHYLQSGNKDKAVKYALAAGQDALAKWSNAEAIKQFTFVLQAIGDKPEQLQKRTIALEGLGDAYDASNNFKQAIITYEQAADIQSDDTAKLRALRKALHASFYQGELGWFKTIFEKAEKCKTADHLEKARILYLEGNIYAAQNDWVTTHKVDQEALFLFEEEYALADTANVLLWIGFGEAILGMLESGVGCALRSIAMYDELGDFRSQMEAYAYAGGTFQACALMEESNQMLAKAIETNGKYKIWDYVRLFPAYVWETLNLIGVDVPASISKGHKALEYFQKTDSLLYAGAVNGVLMIGYALAGDTAKVNEYYNGFKGLPLEIQKNAPSQIYFAPMMGVYYAANNDFETANKWFNDWFTIGKSTFQSPYLEACSRQLFAWSLGKQGKLQEAQAQLAEAQKIIKDVNDKFSHVNVMASAMAQTRPTANEPFPLRMDFVNVSRSRGGIVRIDRFPAKLEILEVSSNCTFHDGQIEFRDDSIGPFEVKTAKLKVKAAEGSFKLNPQVVFTDETGHTKTCNPREMTITVQQQTESGQLKASQGQDEEIDILKKFGLTR